MAAFTPHHHAGRLYKLRSIPREPPNRLYTIWLSTNGGTKEDYRIENTNHQVGKICWVLDCIEGKGVWTRKRTKANPLISTWAWRLCRIRKNLNGCQKCPIESVTLTPETQKTQFQWLNPP